MPPGVRALMLRIYLGEADKFGHEALYKHVVLLLRERGIAGATAHRGIMGYGARTILHAASPLRLSQDLPIIVEAVDTIEAIERVLPEIQVLVKEGLVTTMGVNVHSS